MESKLYGVFVLSKINVLYLLNKDYKNHDYHCYLSNTYYYEQYNLSEMWEFIPDRAERF